MNEASAQIERDVVRTAESEAAVVPLVEMLVLLTADDDAGCTAGQHLSSAYDMLCSADTPLYAWLQSTKAVLKAPARQ